MDVKRNKTKGQELQGKVSKKHKTLDANGQKKPRTWKLNEKSAVSELQISHSLFDEVETISEIKPHTLNFSQFYSSFYALEHDFSKLLLIDKLEHALLGLSIEQISSHFEEDFSDQSGELAIEKCPPFRKNKPILVLSIAKCFLDGEKLTSIDVNIPEIQVVLRDVIDLRDNACKKMNLAGCVCGEDFAMLGQAFIQNRDPPLIEVVPLIELKRLGVSMNVPLEGRDLFLQICYAFEDFAEKHKCIQRYLDPHHVLVQPAGLVANAAVAALVPLLSAQQNIPAATVDTINPAAAVPDLYSLPSAHGADLFAAVIRTHHGTPPGYVFPGGAGAPLRITRFTTTALGTLNW